MKNNNHKVILLVIAIALLFVSITLATYAYYKAKEIYYGSFNVDIESMGVDTLIFSASEDVKIRATVFNFAKDNGHDLHGEAEVDIKLNTTKKETSYCYEVNVELPKEQVFVYSYPGHPELVLDVEKKNYETGKYEKIIDSLDITTKTGIIRVPIEAGSSEYKNVISTVKNIENIASYKATLTLKFFPDVDQYQNDDKSYKAQLKVNLVDC